MSGILNYQSYLKHFAAQAAGTLKPVITRKAGYSGSQVVIFKDGEKDGGNAGTQGKLEIVDPSEATRRRAVSELNLETQINAEAQINISQSGSGKLCR
jgi:hypothetical protein